MSDLVVAYDPAQPPGERLAPEVAAEIAEVAPSSVLAGSVTTLKLANGAVTADKLASQAVTTSKLASGAVTGIKMAAEAVTGPKIAPHAVTGPKAGPGVVTAQDSDDNDITLRQVPIAAADYAALTVPDPSTLYFIY